ncbi:hypothetical protein [Aeromonas phage Akh-2]|nr:hypothetical protein [Aeromonas phage Akh-2]
MNLMCERRTKCQELFVVKMGAIISGLGIMRLIPIPVDTGVLRLRTG